MLKDVICKLDYSNFEEIALVIFGICFLAICWQALRLSSDVSIRMGSIPVDDLVPAVQIVNRAESDATNKARHSDQKEVAE